MMTETMFWCAWDRGEGRDGAFGDDTVARPTMFEVLGGAFVADDRR